MDSRGRGRRGRDGPSKARGRQQQQQPVPTSSSRQSAAPVVAQRPTSTRPLTLPEQVAIATRPSSPLGQRISALQYIHQALFTPTGQAYVQQNFPVLWPALAQLLWAHGDKVCIPAAPVVGALGAIIAELTQTTGGELFDWLLPILSTRQIPSFLPNPSGRSTHISPAQLSSVIIALSECIADLKEPTRVLSRYGTTLMQGCQALLNDKSSSSETLAPLMELLVQASVYKPAFQGRFQDVVEALISRATRDDFPDSAARKVLGKAFVEFAPFWQQRQEFTDGLLDSLLKDLKAAVGSSAGNNNAGRFWGLATCISALLNVQYATASFAGGDLASLSDKAVQCVHAFKSAAASEHLLSFASSDGSVLPEMCTLTTTILESVYAHPPENSEDKSIARISILGCELVHTLAAKLDDDSKSAKSASKHALTLLVLLDKIIESAESLGVAEKVLREVSPACIDALLQKPSSPTAVRSVACLKILNAAVQHNNIATTALTSEHIIQSLISQVPASHSPAVKASVLSLLAGIFNTIQGADVCAKSPQLGFEAAFIAFDALSRTSQDVSSSARLLICSLSAPMCALMAYSSPDWISSTLTNFHHYGGSDTQKLYTEDGSGGEASSEEGSNKGVSTASWNFTPPILQEFLDYVTLQSADEKGVGGAETASSQKKTTNMPTCSAWVQRITKKLSATSTSEESIAQTSWLLAHEAARYSVTLRLKSKWGGPMQTFTMLETALKSLIETFKFNPATASSSCCSTSAYIPSDDATAARKWQAGRVLLEYVFALEQDVMAAAVGGGGEGRAAGPSKAVIIFFAGNSKICREWFKRMRPFALQAAAALRHDHLTIFHGLRYLEDLKQKRAIEVAKQAQKRVHERQAAALALATPASVGGPSILRRSAEARGGAGHAPLLLASARSSTPVSRLSPDSKRPSASIAPRILLSRPKEATTGEQQVQESMERLSLDEEKESIDPASAVMNAALEASASIARALVALRDAAGVKGLQAFCKRAFGNGGKDGSGGVQWSWLDPLVYQASNHYTAALDAYNHLDAGTDTKVQFPILASQVFMSLRADAYAAINDWQGFQRWIQVPHDPQQHACSAFEHKQLYETLNPGYLALSHWEVDKDCDKALEVFKEEQSGGRQEAPQSASCIAIKAMLESTGRDGLQTVVANIATNKLLDAVQLQCATGVFGDGIDDVLQQYVQQLAGLQVSLGKSHLPAGTLAPSSIPEGGVLNAWKHCDNSSSNEGSVVDLARVMSMVPWKAHMLDADAQAVLFTATLAAIKSGEIGVAIDSLKPFIVDVAEEHENTDFQALDKLLGVVTDSVQSGTEASVQYDAIKELLLVASRTDTAVASMSVETMCAKKMLSKAQHYIEALETMPNNARLWWSYAQFLLNQQQAAAPPNEYTSDALSACCKVLHLEACTASSAVREGGSFLLPVLLETLRLLSTIKTPPQELLDLAATIPAATFLPVVTQLLSKLTTVTDVVALDAFKSLVLRLADVHPQSVLGPCLAELNEDDGSNNNGDKDDMKSCLVDLVQQVESLHPDMTHQMRSFFSSLSSVAVLPDEHWHAVLQEAHAALSKRISALQSQLLNHVSESDREDRAVVQQALQRGYSIAAVPVLVALRDHLQCLEDSNNEAMNTPHVVAFKAKFLSVLRKLVEDIATAPKLPRNFASLLSAPAIEEQAPASARKKGLGARRRRRSRRNKEPLQPQTSFEKVVHTTLHEPLNKIKTVMKELGSGLLSGEVAISDIMPAAGFSASSSRGGNTSKYSLLPVPGSTRDGVSIENVDPSVIFLATKTRPKKIGLLGSDGHKYYFLIKGREDLRVDEHLMQMMHAFNAMLRPNQPLQTLAIEAPCISITPIARRAGLIAWVDDSVPLLEVYTQWQHNRAERIQLLALAQQQQARAASNNSAAVVVPASAKPKKPSEAYYEAIKAAGINTNEKREKWPLQKLRDAFLSLMRSVPQNLVADELWLGAAGPMQWRQRQQKYATSLAVSSMSGFLLGVGDRHLDNILLHQTTGSVLHVDFTVVFDRGALLTVPELVPFRLTQALVGGLGVTGVEGRYKTICEQTLGAARMNDDVLTLLMSSLLEDPWVDWSWEVSAKNARISFETAVDLQLLVNQHPFGAAAVKAFSGSGNSDNVSSHVVESIVGLLNLVHSSLGEYIASFTKAAACCTALKESRTQKETCSTTIEESEGKEKQLKLDLEKAKNAVYQAEKDIALLKSQAANAVQECETWQARHVAVVSALTAPSPPLQITLPSSIFDPLKALCPVWLVQVPTAASTSSSIGGLTVVQSALGLVPSDAPVTPTLLLQAAALDDAGFELMNERMELVQSAVDASKQYSVALATLVGDDIVHSTEHAQWLPALQQAALNSKDDLGSSIPLPNFQLHAAVEDKFIALRTLFDAGSSLLEQFSATQTGLQREHAEVSQSAVQAKQALVQGISSAVDLKTCAEAFARVASSHAAAVKELLLADDEDITLVDRLQQCILGFATATVTLRDAVSNESFFPVASTDGEEDTRTDSSSTGFFGWLHDAVNTIDGIATSATELQLITPSLTSLLCDKAQHKQVSEAVNVLAQKISSFASDQPVVAVRTDEAASIAASQEDDDDDASSVSSIDSEQQDEEDVDHDERQSVASSEAPDEETNPPTSKPPQTRAASNDIETVAAGVMDDLLSLANTNEAFAALFPVLQTLSASCGLALLPQSGTSNKDSSLVSIVEAALAKKHTDLGGPAGQLHLAAMVVDMWRTLETTKESDQSSVAEWENVSSLVARYVSSLVKSRMLGPLESNLQSMATDMLRHAETLAGISITLAPAASTREPPRQVVAPELVPFTAFDAVDEANDALLSALEGPLEEEEGGDGDDNLIEEQRGDFKQQDLVALLQHCADATGALAAVDAVQYLTGLALQQYQPQQAHSERLLAGFLWTHEPELLALSKDTSSTVNFGKPPVIAFVNNSPPDGKSQWTVYSHRYQVLQQMKDCIHQLGATLGNIHQWEVQSQAIEQELVYEVTGAMPAANSSLQIVLNDRRTWLMESNGHATNLMHLLQAVLDFEESRASFITSSFTEGKSAVSQTKQLNNKYAAIVHAMEEQRRLFETNQAQAGIYEQQLQSVAQSRVDAAAALQQIERRSTEAEKQFNNLALALVKATQKIVPVVQGLQSSVDAKKLELSSLANVLGFVKNVRAASRRGESVESLHAAATNLQATLLPVVDHVAKIPKAVSALLREMQNVRQDLLQGGRGEAAARSQAVQVVEMLEESIGVVRQCLESSESPKSVLQDLPTHLNDLISLLKATMTTLAIEHNINLSSVSKLINQPNTSAVNTPLDTAATKRRTGNNNRQLSARLYGSGSRPTEKQRQDFAATVLRHFKGKLQGTLPFRSSNNKDDGSAKEVMDVSEQVQRLIKLATSVDNLARMFEGWTAWI